MLAWALQPNAAAECLFHVALAVFSGVQAFQLVASSSRLRLRPRAGSSEPPAMSARVYHTALAGLYLSLGVIDLAVFGILFDKKADFFSTYMKTVCVGVLAIGAGAAHLIVATEAAAAEAVAVDGGGARAGEAGAAAGGPSRPAAAVASRQQAVAKMEILDPLAMAVLALTVARDDYSWVSRYASELAVFEAGLLLATAVAGMHALATSTAAKTARPGGGGLASRSRREGVPGSHWLFAGGIVAMAAVTWSLQMTFQLFVPATSLSSYGMEERVEAVPPMLGFHVFGAFLVRQLVQLLLDRAGGGGGGGSRCRSRRSCFGSCCSGDRRAVRGRRGHKEVYKSVAGAEREEDDGGGGEGGAGGPGGPSSDSDGGGDAEDPSSSSSSGGSSRGSGSD